MNKKLFVDILLFLFMVLEFSRSYMKPLYHEIFGIILIILVIIHLILNKKYLKNIVKGEYNLSRTIMLIINGFFFLAFFLSILFGILSSQDLFPFLNKGSLTTIKLHKVFAYVSLIFIGLHIGLNFNAMFNKLRKYLKNQIIIYILSTIIIIYGIYSFIKLDILKHLFGTYGFSIGTGNIISNILMYLSIIITISLLTNIFYKIIRKENKNGK